MTNLIEALKKNDIHNIHLLLQQLGKTPFMKDSKPTPVDEAVSLAWFLENVFYGVASAIQSKIDDEFDLPVDENGSLAELGRSEERRVGKEWFSTCRSRWRPSRE